MKLTEQVYAQAMLLAGSMVQEQEELLKLLCRSTCSSLESRLREGLSPEDCKADFIAAASLYALAAMAAVGDRDGLKEWKAGDVTLRRNTNDTASNCLYNQAELIIAPYLKDRFSFRGV